MRKPQRDRHAFLILSWFLGVFALVQVVGSVAFDYFVPRVRFAYLYRQYEKGAALEQPWSIVFLGSSRTGTCLMDAQASDLLHQRFGASTGEVVNLAVPLGDLLCSDSILKEVLAQGHQPRIVVVEVCPEFLNAHNAWLEHYLERQLCWHELPRFASELQENQLLGKMAEYRLLPLYAYHKGFWNAWSDEGEKLWKRLRHQPTAQDSASRRREWERILGTFEQITPKEKEEKIQSGLKLTRTGLRDYAVGGQGAQALQNIIARCREHHCELVLYLPPFPTVHCELYDAGIEQAYQQQLSQVASPSVTFFDGRHTLHDALFLDSHHANAEGGVRFTEQLMQHVLGRWR